MDRLAFEITEPLESLKVEERLNINLNESDILWLGEFEFKNATRIELDKFKDCDGFNRVYIYESGKEIGLLRTEDDLYLRVIDSVTNKNTGEKGRLLDLTKNDPEFEGEI